MTCILTIGRLGRICLAGLVVIRRASLDIGNSDPMLSVSPYPNPLLQSCFYSINPITCSLMIDDRVNDAFTIALNHLPIWFPWSCCSFHWRVRQVRRHKLLPHPSASAQQRDLHF